MGMFSVLPDKEAAPELPLVVNDVTAEAASAANPMTCDSSTCGNVPGVTDGELMTMIV